MATVEIKQNKNQCTEIYVDGHKVNRVKGYALTQNAIEVPLLELEMAVLDKDISLQNARVDISVSHQTLQDAVKILNFELHKHGDIYDAFQASILSVLKPKEHYIGDGEFSIEAEEGAYYLAEEILKRIIGEE